MKVQFEPELEQRKPLKQLVEAATPVLEEELANPLREVTVTWGFRADDHGRPRIRLTICHWTGEEDSAEFSPEELQPPENARRRFGRFWGDLLRKITQHQMEKLLKLEAEEAEEKGS